ncbi:alpha/beta fold hydrolase [Halomonas koreensis]|uniref:Alpha/beta fold hydrolase n=1 Tax=Halomonas koreensis TaxID=245385 RepID=A0ABU1G3L7_9GAMM|nr:alpha/beta fold hydrolase [Halomonas koreensis]MDR5867538.1 alpha/beta fold hydrolase [Halomonas koreensis]
MDALTFVRVRELDVAVRIWHPEAPRSLIAWHGLTCHGGDFAGFARLLGPGWRVLAPDTPGRGLSSWSLYPAHDYRHDHYMTIALAVLDHFDLPRAPWVGTSMGGLLGLLLAAAPAGAGRIERLVLNDVGPKLAPGRLAALAGHFAVPLRVWRFDDLVAELRRLYAGFGVQDEAGWRRLALESARRLPDGSWTLHYDPRIGEQFIHDSPRDLWADWRALRCPLMVVRGADSSLLDADTVARMRALQPDMRYLEAVGCGHAPMLDRPGQVRPIADFLAPAARRPWWRRGLARLSGAGHG